MKEAEDRSSYHEEAEKLFVTYMEWNEYFLDETDPNVVFYEDNNKIEKLTTAQIIEIICRTGMFNVHDFEKMIQELSKLYWMLSDDYQSSA